MPKVKISKEELLLKAIKVFRQKGYYNTSMQDLANEVGLQKGSFYHYFASKEALMAVILENTLDYLKNKVFALAWDESLNPRIRLEKILYKLGKVLLSEKGGCIVGNTTLETAGQIENFNSLLKQIFDAWLAALIHIYSHQYDQKTAEILGHKTIMELEGCVMLHQIYPEKDLLMETYHEIMKRMP